MSKAVRNICELQKRMWDHRNSYAHASNDTIQQHEEEAMTAAIRWEFAVGQMDYLWHTQVFSQEKSNIY